MDAALNQVRPLVRNPFLVTVLAPLIPHLLGSVFNIWYNMVIIDPLLGASGLRTRFVSTIICWNLIVYPVAVGIWLRLILSLRPTFRRLLRDETIPAEQLDSARRRLVNLPWYGAIIAAIAWLLCIPVFLISLSLTGRPLGAQLF